MVQDSRKERLWFLDLAYPEAWCGGERLRWQDCESGLPRLHSKTAFQNRQTDRQVYIEIPGKKIPCVGWI